MIHILEQSDTILNRFVGELRDEAIQKDRLRFRHNLKRIGSIMAYEISRTLNYYDQSIQTPLGECVVRVPSNEIVLATILRAGIPMHNGMLEVFDYADNAFISAYRHWSKDGTMKIVMDQISTPSLEGKTLIIVDPMLATGQSVEHTYTALIEKGGIPDHTHFASVIASEEGLEYVQKHLPMDQISIWTASVDSETTVKNYIVPGMGDPGDLAFGKKL